MSTRSGESISSESISLRRNNDRFYFSFLFYYSTGSFVRIHEYNTNAQMYARRYARRSYRLSGHRKREIAMDSSCPRSRPSTILSLSLLLYAVYQQAPHDKQSSISFFESFSYLLRSIYFHDFFLLLYFLIFKFTSTTTSTRSKPPICTVRTSLFSSLFSFLRFIRVYFVFERKGSRIKNTHTHLHPFRYPSPFYHIDKLPLLEIRRRPIEIVWE